MDSYIIVRGNGLRTVKVMARNTGVISVDTLRSAFQLEPDVVVGLFRNGIALECSRENDSFFFHLQSEWIGSEFELVWDESRRSRPVTPMIEGAFERMEVDVNYSDEIQRNIEMMSKYVYKINGITACATAVGPNILATCYHCVQHVVPSGPGLDEIKCHREAVIELTNSTGDVKLKSRIIIYSIEKDTVLLETLDGVKLMNEGEIALTDGWVGQSYYVLGTPVSDDGSPLQVISGRISSKLNYTINTKEIYTLHGHGSARPGASGGPVFARILTFGKPALIGIVQSGQSINANTPLVTFVSSHYVKIISSMTLRTIFDKIPFQFKF